MSLTHVANGAYQAVSSSATINIPTGTADNDLLFTVVNCINTVSITDIDSSWNLVASQDSGATIKTYVYYKFASSEPATYTITLDASNKVSCDCLAYRDFDHDPDDIIGATSNTVYVVSNQQVRATSMVVPNDNSALFWFGNHYATLARTLTAPTSPVGFTEDLNAYYSTADFRVVVASMIFATAGATGNMEGALGSVATQKVGIAVSINPGVGFSGGAGAGRFASNLNLLGVS